MKLSDDAHARVETFLRSHLQDESLKLPSIIFSSGRAARWLTRALQTDAITVGRLILISPGVLRKDELGRLIAPGDLVVHEATHVCQFQRAGLVRFTVSYLGGFFRELRAQGKADRTARLAAYRAIREERDAYEAGRGYAAWSALERRPREGQE